MKRLSNITFRYIKASKSRTRMILIGIILSITLITTISIFASSIQNMMIKEIELKSGKQQGGYMFLEPSQLKTLNEHFLLNCVGESIYLGYQNLVGNNSLNLSYKDDTSLKLNNIELLEGNYPTKENEIAIESWILEIMNINPSIGEKIKIDYQRHAKDKSGSIIEYNGDNTFILSGILKDHPNSKIGYYGTGIISKDYIESNIPEEKINRTAIVTLKSNKSPEQILRYIGEQIGLSEDQIYVNDDLIKMKGGNMEANIPFILLGLLVVISTIVVIYNMFYISVLERINQFGIFRSLGATPRQIRVLVFNEGLIFGVIGIPIGILFGYILSYFIVPLIPINGTITMASSPYIIPIVIIIGLFTIMISVFKPSKIASKISPIEALRSELLIIKNKSKKAKNHRLGNLFGIMGKMSYENLWKNKKRTWMAIISLTLSCILFIVFSTIFASMNVENLTRSIISSDYILLSGNRGYDGFSEDITKEIDEIEEIDYYDKYFDVSDYARIDINVTDDTEEIKNELKKITYRYKGATLKSYIEEKEKLEKEKNQMKFLALTLIIVIAIIGMLNMVNTMITSIISRKKEFGMLRAVGMTNDQLKKLIRLEGMYYGLISAVLSSFIGSFLAYSFYDLMKKEATYMTWKFPIFEIILIFIGVIIASIISTQFGLKRVVNDSIVESIRVTE